MRDGPAAAKEGDQEYDGADYHEQGAHRCLRVLGLHLDHHPHRHQRQPEYLQNNRFCI